MDDTAFVKKVIHPELVKNMKEILADKHGRKVLLYFLAPENKSYFTPTILKIAGGDPLGALYLGEKQHTSDQKLEITPVPPVSTSKKDTSVSGLFPLSLVQAFQYILLMLATTAGEKTRAGHKRDGG